MVKSVSFFVWPAVLGLCFASFFTIDAQGQHTAAAKNTKPDADAPTTATSAGPAVLPHPHKVYTDTAQNKLFWPMDMPFWVRLAASPDANAPSFLLQRVAPEPEIKSTITSEQYQKGGIELEIRNKQYIRWFNYITKETVFLQFFSDGDAPVTKATCTGAPTAVVGQQTFYGVGLHCSLASTDELSGVDTTYVSMNAAAWKPYTSEMGLSHEGPMVLGYYAVDHVGWAETPVAMRFTVDLTPPATKHSITGNAQGDTLSTQAKFNVTSSDALSGVATLNARFDHDDFKPVTGAELSVAGLSDGNHTLNYYSVDRVGNREATHEVSFYVDRTAPIADSHIVGDLFVAPGGTRFVSSRSHVQLGAQDNKSGVKQITYSLEANNFQPYSAPFTLPAKAGAAKVSYRVADNLGNTSEVATLPYTMDLTAPQSNFEITGPHYQVRSDIFITSASHISLSSTDEGSGVQKTLYQEEGETESHPYSAALAYPDEGRRLVRFWSLDKVNNRELDRAMVLITDNTPPQIFANFSLKSTAISADGVPVFRRLTSLFLGATDNAAGVHKIYYSLDGGKEMEYSTPLVLDHDGTFDLKIRVDDNLGNQTTKQLRFTITG